MNWDGEGFMPHDDPNVKIMKAQSEISDLLKRETGIYAEIGKLAFQRSSGQFPELESKLRLVQIDLAEAQSHLERVQAEAERKQQEEQMFNESICPQCGRANQSGVEFCQECRARLGTFKCRNCSASLAPGTRFCGECGTKQEL